MRQKIEQAIEKINNSNTIKYEDRELIIEKIKEWQDEEKAINDIAVRFEKWWLELEPIFAEIGLV